MHLRVCYSISELGKLIDNIANFAFGTSAQVTGWLLSS